MRAERVSRVGKEERRLDAAEAKREDSSGSKDVGK